MLSGILLGIGAAALLYNNYRDGVMARLYAEAAGYPQYYRGSAESQAAVKILATYRGRRSTILLLNIALRQNPLAPQAQTEAIKALSKRKDPQIAVKLANLLQPHEGLDTRQAAAVALQNLPCNHECVSSILHYLERVWRGEPNHEDMWVDPQNDRTSVGNNQQILCRNLYSVLQREKIETLTNLAEVYGLGSVDPSPFALDLVSRAGIPEACLYLQESQRQIKDLSPEFFKAPRQELQAAISSLKCK